MDIGSYFIDVSSLPDNAQGFVQLLFLGGTYGYILCFASNLISDGSELLLLVPSMAGVIGSVVLPVLGAVPDGCMVLFSGLGPGAQGKYWIIKLLTFYLFLCVAADFISLLNISDWYCCISFYLKSCHAINLCRTIECWHWNFGGIYDHALDDAMVSKHPWWACEY